jgi:hypothetical protein
VNADRLLHLFDQRHAALGDWRNRWEQLSQYILPAQRTFTSTASLGQRRDEQLIYDSTALEANERLATRMHEALTSPATQWFKLRFATPEANEDDTAREWLEECERRIRDALRVSNFDMTMGQFYLDLGALGTAIIDASERRPDEARFSGFVFRNYHLGGVAVAEGADGSVESVMWRFDMTAEQWCDQFRDDAPEKAKAYCAEGKPDTVLPALLCRYPRRDAPAEGVLLPKERPWAETWLCMPSRELVRDDGTYEKAVFVGRWRKRSSDIMGYGPGERALPTIRTINEAERLELAAWAKKIDPPIKTTANNVIGDLDIKAKGLTVLRKMDDTAQWDIEPDIQHHMIELEDKRYQVREIFRYHSLELPPREQVGEMTAYEVAKRVEQVYRALGPTIVQLQADVLNPLIRRCFGIMLRRGAFPALPGMLNASLRIDYVGAMALAQRAVEIEAIDRFVADALALAQSGVPEATDLIDMDKAQRYKAGIMGVPAIVLRSVTEVDAIRRARNEQLAAQAQTEQLKGEAEAMKSLGQAVGQDMMSAAVQRIAERARR